MLHFLRHCEIDKSRWDACLQKADRPLLYAQAWYLDIVCSGQWEALVEIQKGEYVSLLPLPVKKVLGQKYVYQPLFTQQLGLFLTPASHHHSVEEYLPLVVARFAQVHYQLFLAKPVSLPTSWSSRSRPNYELTLLLPYPQMLQEYALNLRRNLKKAQAAGLTGTTGTSIQPLIQLFKSTKGQELQELRKSHYRVVEQLFLKAQQEKAGELWEVWRDNTLLAAAFLLVSPQRITFLFGASSAEGRQFNAMAFLLDQVLQREAGSGKIFDFEGSEVPGVAKFYANFGAKPVWYLSLNFQNLSPAQQWTRNVFTSLVKRLR